MYSQHMGVAMGDGSSYRISIILYLLCWEWKSTLPQRIKGPHQRDKAKKTKTLTSLLIRQLEILTSRRLTSRGTFSVLTPLKPNKRIATAGTRWFHERTWMVLTLQLCYRPLRKEECYTPIKLFFPYLNAIRTIRLRPLIFPMSLHILPKHFCRVR